MATSIEQWETDLHTYWWTIIYLYIQNQLFAIAILRCIWL